MYLSAVSCSCLAHSFDISQALLPIVEIPMLRGVNRGVGTILSVIVFIHVFRKWALKVFLTLWDVKFQALSYSMLIFIT